MRCEGVQEYLAERLAGSMSESLSRTVYSSVRTHMLSCPECCAEMEDLEEMQKLLQTLPVEPCDSDFMRGRFHLLIGKTETGNRTPAIERRPTLPVRQLKVVLVTLLATIVVIAAFLAARQAVKRISVARAVQPRSTPANVPASIPVAATIRTGAISGQVRYRDEGPLPKVRVSVITVPQPGVASTEMTIEASADGKYRLESIPAGQYYVLARMADATSYYPGSKVIAGAVIVSIPAGANLEGMDFPISASAGTSTASTVPLEATKTTDDSQMVAVDVTLRLDTGGRLPYWPDTSIVFTSMSGAPRVAASCVVGNLFRASVPANGSYALMVSNVAAGYSVQSIVDGRMTDLLHGGVFLSVTHPAASSRIVVTLSKN